jgi:hypothetical protein
MHRLMGNAKHFLASAMLSRSKHPNYLTFLTKSSCPLCVTEGAPSGCYFPGQDGITLQAFT